MYPHFSCRHFKPAQHQKKNHEIYFLENLFCIKDLKSAITNPKNSTKVITEAPKAKPSQPPTVAEKKNNTYFTQV